VKIKELAIVTAQRTADSVKRKCIGKQSPNTPQTISMEVQTGEVNTRYASKLVDFFIHTDLRAWVPRMPVHSALCHSALPLFDFQHRSHHSQLVRQSLDRSLLC